MLAARLAGDREIEDLDALITAARLEIHEPRYIVDDTRTRPTDLTERVSPLVSQLTDFTPPRPA